MHNRPARFRSTVAAALLLFCLTSRLSAGQRLVGIRGAKLWPSKFVSPDGLTLWLCFADDWVRKHPSDPPGTRYGMCLHETKLLRLEWSSPQTIGRVLLFDRPNRYDYITAGELTFSDGSAVKVGALPDDASAGREVTFPPRKVTWLRFTVTGVKTGYPHIGLAEIAVFAAGA